MQPTGYDFAPLLRSLFLVSAFVFFQGCGGGGGSSSAPIGPVPAPAPAPANFTLNVDIAGDGSGIVASSPTGISCSDACQATFTSGSEVTLTVTPADDSTFGGWAGDCAGNVESCVIVLDRNRTTTATFIPDVLPSSANQAVLGPLSGAEIQAFRLTDLDSAIEGPLKSRESLADVGRAGTFELLLTGIPDTEWILVSATGGVDIDRDDDGVVDESPIAHLGTIHALAPANLWRAGDRTVNLLSEVAWREVEPLARAGDMQALLDRLHELARLTLYDDLDGDDIIDAKDLVAFRPSNIVHQNAVSVGFQELRNLTTAILLAREDEVGSTIEETFGSLFNPPPLSLTVGVDTGGGRGNGRIVSEPPGIDCGDICQASFPIGTTVTLHAIADDDSFAFEWRGVCDLQASECTLVLDSDLTAFHSFSKASTLTLQIRGDGNGRVVSNVPGLDCSEDCSVAFSERLQPTLTATPVPGSVFLGWSTLCFTNTDDPCPVSTTGPLTLSSVDPPTVRAEFGRFDANFEAIASDRAILAVWDETEGIAFDLYVSTEPDCDIENYTLCANGILLTNQQRPTLIANLNNGTTYYVVQEWRDPKGFVSVTRAPGRSPEGYSRLNATGSLDCVDDIAKKDCPITTHPNQDAERGRNALARRGLLTKDGAGEAGSDFTKLDAWGGPLPNDAVEWSCVRDNHTGLIWEVKTDDGGLRHFKHTYSWFEFDNAGNFVQTGQPDGGLCTEALACDTASYTAAVNEIHLCGAADWRLPTRMELSSIFHYGRPSVAIDTAFFPLHTITGYWTASAAPQFDLAWTISITDGATAQSPKSSSRHVRLVRSGPTVQEVEAP